MTPDAVVSRRTSASLVCALVALAGWSSTNAACANAADVGRDTHATSGDAGGDVSSEASVPGDSDTSGGFEGGLCTGSPPTCSADGRSVVDCTGAVVHACGDTEGCVKGACVNACDSAVASKSSVGCEYYLHNPRISYATGGLGAYDDGRGCYAVFVANTWSAPVTVRGDVAGTALDLSKYTYLPSGGGTSLTMTPIGEGGAIPPGKVGIVFLREGHDNGPRISYKCGYGVKVADSDPAAAGWTDPSYDSSIGMQALRLVASAPVVAYDILPFGGGRSAVSDAALLLPTSTWGTNYIAITASPLSESLTRPTIAIVASADATTVQINPTVDIKPVGGSGVAGTTAGTPVSYTLQKGQVLRIEQDADLLGSIISSDKPVGLFAEQQCITIAPGGACDSAHEQIPPIQAFGSEYVYARYRNRVDGTDETPPTRLTGAVDGTTLTFDPVPAGAPLTLKRGQSVEVRSSAPFVVKSQDADHPFYVATYMTGGAPLADGNGDPEFVGVVPTAQYLNKYVFFSDPTYPETNLVFVRKKAADGTFKDVKLDCAGTLSGWTPVGTGGNYEVTTRDLVRHNFAPQAGCDNGAHQANSDGPFALTVWGWGTAETGTLTSGFYSQYVSYAYPAGASVQLINAVRVPIR